MSNVSWAVPSTIVGGCGQSRDARRPGPSAFAWRPLLASRRLHWRHQEVEYDPPEPPANPPARPSADDLHARGAPAQSRRAGAVAPRRRSRAALRSALREGVTAAALRSTIREGGPPPQLSGPLSRAPDGTTPQPPRVAVTSGAPHER